MTNLSDPYHTMDELYAHRNLLFVCLLNSLLDAAVDANSFKTLRDAEGKQEEGWFLAGLDIPGVGQISYHLPIELWSALNVAEREYNFTYDGHTSEDVINRLHLLAAHLFATGNI